MNDNDRMTSKTSRNKNATRSLVKCHNLDNIRYTYFKIASIKNLLTNLKIS